MPSSLAQELLQEFRFACKDNLPSSRLAALATCGSDRKPHVRTVVLHEVTERQVLLVVSRLHQKWKQLEENPLAELMIWWPEYELQYRVSGKCSELPSSVARERWHTLPCAVRKLDVAYGKSFLPGTPVDSYQDMAETVEKRSYGKSLTELPDHVTAIAFTINEIERLKASQSDRLHDRRKAEFKDGAWRELRLVP